MKREIIGAKRHSRVPSPGAAGRDSSSASGASKRANLSATDRDRRALAIDVIWSDIKTVEADVLLVGHYLGVLPQTAELELDQLVSGRSVSAAVLRSLKTRAKACKTRIPTAFRSMLPSLADCSCSLISLMFLSEVSPLSSRLIGLSPASNGSCCLLVSMESRWASRARWRDNCALFIALVRWNWRPANALKH